MLFHNLLALNLTLRKELNKHFLFFLLWVSVSPPLLPFPGLGSEVQPYMGPRHSQQLPTSPRMPQTSPQKRQRRVCVAARDRTGRSIQQTDSPVHSQNTPRTATGERKAIPKHDVEITGKSIKKAVSPRDRNPQESRTPSTLTACYYMQLQQQTGE